MKIKIISAVFAFGTIFCIFLSTDKKNRKQILLIFRDENNRKQILLTFRKAFLSIVLIGSNFNLNYAQASDETVQNVSVNKDAEALTSKPSSKGGYIPHPKDSEQNRLDNEAWNAHNRALEQKKTAEQLRKASEEAKKIAEEARRVAEDATKKAQEMELNAVQAEEKARLLAQKSSEAQKHSRIDYDLEEKRREERRKLREQEYRKPVVSLPRLPEGKKPSPKPKKWFSKIFTWQWQP